MSRWTGRYCQATRIVRLIDRLRANRDGALIVDLAEEFQVSRRQIERDLIAVGEAGYMIETEVREAEHAGVIRTRTFAILREKKRGALVSFPHAYPAIPREAKPLRVVVEAPATNIPAHLPAAHVTQLPDDRVRLEWMMRNWGDVIPWILAQGAQARAVEPPALVRAVADELRRALDPYT